MRLSLSTAPLLLTVPALGYAQGEILQLYGTSPGEQYGAVVDGLGDVNGDGVADLVVSTEGPVDQVFVHSGAYGSVLLHRISSGPGGFGASVAGAGDVDGDGVPDLVVGDPFADPPGAPLDPNTGRVAVFSGADGTVLLDVFGPFVQDRIGTSVAPAGDVDRDGTLDVLVGGRDVALVYSGATGAPLHEWVGCNDDFGNAVAGIGDADADGWPDVAVYADGIPPFGCDLGVSVFSGRTGEELFRHLTDEPQQVGPQAVSGAGDVDGDGHDDLLVGEHGTPDICPDDARVVVVSGADGSTIHEILAPASCGFGRAVDSVGDLDHDGAPEFAYGIVGSTGGGRARVHSGATGELLWEFVEEDAVLSDKYGYSLAAAGDVDGDGRPDIVLGGPWDEDASGETVGGVKVLRGCNGAVAAYGAGLAGTGGLVPVLSAVGCPNLEAEVTVHVADGLPGATGLSVLGVEPTALPLVGGTLLVVPLVVHGHELSAEGAHAVTFQAPAEPTAIGATLYWQAGYVDPAAPLGWSMTNGLAITFGATP